MAWSFAACSGVMIQSGGNSARQVVQTGDRRSTTSA
jgi:hypothetical protein